MTPHGLVEVTTDGRLSAFSPHAVAALVGQSSGGTNVYFVRDDAPLTVDQSTDELLDAIAAVYAPPVLHVPDELEAARLPDVDPPGDT